MRRIFFCALTGLAASAVFSTALLAGSPNVANYPLRVHVVQNSNRTHYHDRIVDYVDGEGRADLYENGQPRGFNYGFRCDDRVRLSEGYETYPARWKKPGAELEILQPVLGKPGATWACTLKVEMKENIVYVRHNGLVDERPAAEFKEWMDKRQYDPEHGKDVPTPAKNEPAPDTPGQAAPAPVAPAPSGTGATTPQ
jgi:hypothetical protein